MSCSITASCSAVPRAIVDKVAADLLKVVAMPDVRHRLADQGVDVEPMDSAQFAAFIKSEAVRYAQVIKDAGIKIE